jgi:ribose 5-phosphate isomerase A
MSQQDQKDKVGKAVAEHPLIKDGAVIGIGTGSTVFPFIEALGELVAGGLKITTVVTSEDSKTKCEALDIKVVSIDSVEKIDIAIDGADEVDPKFNLIKGGGGALTREKEVDYKADYFVVIIDESKNVDTLGTFPLPVEVKKNVWEEVKKTLEKKLGCKATLRGGDEPFVTDSNGHILDCKFEYITNPERLEKLINEIEGIVQNGIFTGDKVDEVWVGTDDDVIVKKNE